MTNRLVALAPANIVICIRILRFSGLLDAVICVLWTAIFRQRSSHTLRTQFVFIMLSRKHLRNTNTPETYLFSKQFETMNVHVKNMAGSLTNCSKAQGEKCDVVVKNGRFSFVVDHDEGKDDHEEWEKRENHGGALKALKLGRWSW